MSSSDIEMNNSDIFICAAFRQMLLDSDPEGENQLNRETAISIANYLAQIPPDDQLQPAVMANHITAFCERSGNEQLYEWLGEMYDRLDKDGIDTLVKKTGDPDDEVDSPSITTRMLENESRDICNFLQKWAIKNQNNPENQPENQHEQQQKS